MKVDVYFSTVHSLEKWDWENTKNDNYESKLTGDCVKLEESHIYSIEIVKISKVIREYTSKSQ